MGIIQAAVGYEDDGTIICARERTEVIQEEIDLCGYFVIVTSKQMTAEEALELYKSRDVSEKLFREIRVILGTGACGYSQMRMQVRRSSWNL